MNFPWEGERKLGNLWALFGSLKFHLELRKCGVNERKINEGNYKFEFS